MDGRRALWLFVAPAVVVLLDAAPAHAGNDDEVLVGNDAALTGGAVTATARGGGALYWIYALVAALALVLQACAGQVAPITRAQR